MIRLAVIGLGERAAWVLKLMGEVAPDIRLTVVVDPADEATLRQRIEQNGLRCADRLGIYKDLDRLLDKGEELDGAVIGTRCHLHTPQAMRLAETGLPLFLEKPVAISWTQLDQLREAFVGRDDGVVVSFPLRRTPLFDAAIDVVRSGRLGPINQVQAVNFVSYGAVYIDNWYRDYGLAGGLWLQKATHDFDYIHRLAEGEPVAVSAMHTQAVWRPPVLNQDAGSALIRYHHGVHACYAQNFLSRHGAGARGATVTGENATLRFDWTRHEVLVIDHADQRVDRTEIKTEEGHGGGDQRLAENFLQVIRGNEPPLTTLADGLRSAATCLAARDAAHRGTVESIPDRFALDGSSDTPFVDTTTIEPPLGPPDESARD